MAVQRPVAEKWEKVTGTVLLEGYGLTECSPVVAVNPPQIEAYKGAIGMPVPSTDIKLLDDDGNPATPGDIGTLAVKLPLPPGSFPTLCLKLLMFLNPENQI